ncbi:MAG TPA: lasso peptide biosynthesis B2 protein [Thermoanaerobaculia bacterium]
MQLPTLRRALSLAPEDWIRFAQAWIVLWIASLGLRWLPFARMERLLTPVQKGRRSSDDCVVARCVWATAAASRHHLKRMTCLPRALGLRWLLGRAGFAADLRIGVRREGDQLLAHAWVELDGQPVGEAQGEPSPFQPLLEIPGDLRTASTTRGSSSNPEG